MQLKILLINPWIHDFAAYNLWARPLGLLRVAEHLSAYDVAFSFIDCTGAHGTQRYGAGRYRAETVPKPALLRDIPRRYKRYGIGAEEFRARLNAAGPCDLVFVTSIMSYWYPGVQEAVSLVREQWGDVPVVLGGVYATLYPDHALNHAGVDFIYQGEAGTQLACALATFGFRLKRRKRGEGPLPYYRLGLYETHPFAPLLTASGCPFSCSYCAAPLLSSAYRPRQLDSVAREAAELYALGVRHFAFYDDALLVNADNHIKPLLRRLAVRCPEASFHTPNGLHARFIDEELARLMRLSNFRTIRLSLETADGARQLGSGGKVTTEEFERATALLKAQGFTKEYLGAYLMYGLPGQGLEEVREGVRFLKSLGLRIHLTEFSPLRGTACWSDLVREGVISDDLAPLLTNNSVFSLLYAGYNASELDELKLDVKAYNAT